MSMVDNRVTQIDMDHIAHQLLAVIPHDGIMIERHAGIKRVVDQGVADRLHVRSEGPHTMEGMYLTVHRVGIDVEGHNLERVGMHEKRVSLGVIDGHSTVCTQGKARVLIILAVVARQLVTVEGIDIDNIEECLAEAHLAVVIDTIAHKHLTVVVEYRAVHETGTFKLRVVIPLFRVDMTFTRGDI